MYQAIAESERVITKGQIIELNHEGDEPLVEWDAEDPASVEGAKLTFESLKSKGYSLFHSKKGKRGVRMETFDPEAEKIIVIKNIVAG